MKFFITFFLTVFTCNLFAVDITFVWGWGCPTDVNDPLYTVCHENYDYDDFEVEYFNIYYKSGGTAATVKTEFNGTGLNGGMASPINVSLPTDLEGYAVTIRDFQEGQVYFVAVSAYAHKKTDVNDKLESDPIKVQINTSTPSTPKNLKIIASIESNLNRGGMTIASLAHSAKSFLLYKLDMTESLENAIVDLRVNMSEEYQNKSDVEVAAAINNAYEMLTYNHDASLIVVF